MKKKRTILLTLLIIVLGVLAYVLYITNVIPHKMYSSDHFNIEVYHSNVDKDNDSIDDQTDILIGVRNYISTSPIYGSKYYASGYPDDEYGVCTDVVAFGLKNAGYDIRELLNEDVKNNRDAYNIDVIDKNIDFRRVSNLDVYLKRKAISLTTDLKKIEEWQGGDIVVFKRHIAIVSNMRNYKGIPFIIHNVGRNQKSYEEDMLELYKSDIIGHYRIS